MILDLYHRHKNLLIQFLQDYIIDLATHNMAGIHISTMQVQSEKSENFQVGKIIITNQKIIDMWGNAKISRSKLLTEAFTSIQFLIRPINYWQRIQQNYFFGFSNHIPDKPVIRNRFSWTS